MRKTSLDLGLLTVESFTTEEFQSATTPGAVGTAADTQDVEACNSPKCGPTFWKTCEETQ